jgi:hypothetical protein
MVSANRVDSRLDKIQQAKHDPAAPEPPGYRCRAGVPGGRSGLACRAVVLRLDRYSGLDRAGIHHHRLANGNISPAATNRNSGIFKNIHHYRSTKMPAQPKLQESKSSTHSLHPTKNILIIEYQDVPRPGQPAQRREASHPPPTTQCLYNASQPSAPP